MKPPFGYETRAAFDGAEATLRPNMMTLAHMLVKWWGFKLIAKLSPGTILIESPFCLPEQGENLERPFQSYTWWTLCDNGGEISVRPVNLEKPSIDPPYVQHRMTVPMGRLAWFCAMTMKNEPIDWNYEGADDIGLVD